MGPSMTTPTPEQIDKLAFNLGSMGVKVPARDTAFFQAIVRQWLEEIGKANENRPEPNPKRGSPPFPEVEAAGGGGNSPDVSNAHSALPVGGGK